MRSTLFVKLFLLISLLSSQALSLFASSTAMAKMQRFADENTLVICTGKTVKWISADIYYQTGEIFELEAQGMDPSIDTQHETSCVLAQLADAPKTLVDVILFSPVSLSLYFESAVNQVQASIRRSNRFFSSRAPPLTFL